VEAVMLQMQEVAPSHQLVSLMLQMLVVGLNRSVDFLLQLYLEDK